MQILLLHGFHRNESFNPNMSFLEAGGVALLVQLATQDWPKGVSASHPAMNPL